MAQGSTGGGGAEFVRRIVNDPKSVPDVVRLEGYLGASSEDGHERLYLSADLSSYVEIPKDAILHQMDVPAAHDPHGAVVVWVKKDAALQYKMAPGPTALAHYFAGAVAAGAAAGGAAAPGALPLPVSIGVACTALPAACPPPTPACPTHHPTCLPICTHIPACQHTQIGQASCAPICTVHTCAGHATCAPVCTVQTCAGHLTCAPVCTVHTCAVQATCSPVCTVHTCAGHATCAPACTVHTCVGQATCAPIVCTHPPACPAPTPACSHLVMCHPTLPVVCHQTLPAVCVQSAVVVCHPTLACPVASVPVCPPPQSIACGSIACGSIACGGGLGAGGIM